MARKLRGSLFVSLDGVIQGPGGPGEDITGGFDEGGWVFKLADEGINETLGGLFASPFDLLLGRRTYDIFAAYWPYIDAEEGGMGDLFTKVTKFVLSHERVDTGWENTQRLADIDAVAALKQTDGPDLLIQGSGTLYPALLSAGLLDEVTLFTYPVTLGRGKRWFGDATPARMLSVSDSRVTEKGTVVTTYRDPGPIPAYPADAPPQSTSAREQQRQDAMQAGKW